MAYLKKRIETSIKNIGKHERFKEITCPKCGLVQDLAIDWDYQICSCGEYLYDYR